MKELENGAKVEELCRKLGVSEATVYNWRKRCAGISTPEERWLKELEEVNDRAKGVIRGSRWWALSVVITLIKP